MIHRAQNFWSYNTKPKIHHHQRSEATSKDISNDTPNTIRMVYQSPTVALEVNSAAIPAEIPVFQLPLNDISTIPEGAEIHKGFIVRVPLQPHRERRFSGLLSLSNTNDLVIGGLAASSIKFDSFSWTNLPD
jgi:hypothetical protein